MKKLMELMAEELASAFEKAGYDPSYGKVTVSNRPDLCEYQCNGAMAAAKAYKKKPIDIANEVVEKLQGNEMFSEITAVMPGFINIRLNGEYLASYMNGMQAEDKLGVEESEVTETANFTNDLGADSLDTVELLMEFERVFGIKIPDEETATIVTVQDAIDKVTAKLAEKE